MGLHIVRSESFFESDQPGVRNIVRGGQLEDNSESYLSPFTTRYGSPELRHIWSEINKRRTWRKIWIAIAETLHKANLVSQAELDDLKKHEQYIYLPEAKKHEEIIHHELMSEVHAFALQCPVGGRVIHWGCTSADIMDNADVMLMEESLQHISSKIVRLIHSFSTKVEQYANTPTLAFTHLQPAALTTIGYRLSQYLEDIKHDAANIRILSIKGKGIRGSVGTSATFIQLLKGTTMSIDAFEQVISEKLGISFSKVSTQTSSRKQEYHLLCALAGIGQSLHKFALDVRILQSPISGEFSEMFEEPQIGSSAMPFKRNPINCENICSLSRLLSALPQTAWHNAASTMLERTLDDSANRRVILPEAFLIADEIISRSQKVIDGLQVNEKIAGDLVAKFGPFGQIENLLIELVKRGQNRQRMHEVLRGTCMRAWTAIQAGEKNKLIGFLCHDLQGVMTPAEIGEAMA